MVDLWRQPTRYTAFGSTDHIHGCHGQRRMGAVPVCSNWNCALHRTGQWTNNRRFQFQISFVGQCRSDVQYRSPLMGWTAVCVIMY